MIESRKHRYRWLKRGIKAVYVLRSMSPLLRDEIAYIYNVVKAIE